MHYFITCQQKIENVFYGTKTSYKLSSFWQSRIWNNYVFKHLVDVKQHLHIFCLDGRFLNKVKFNLDFTAAKVSAKKALEVMLNLIWEHKLCLPDKIAKLSNCPSSILPSIYRVILSHLLVKRSWLRPKWVSLQS